MEGISQNQLIENTGKIFHMFDELPLSYAVYKVVSGPKGPDAVVLYANRRFMTMTRKTPETLIGLRITRFFDLPPEEWLTLAVAAGLEGRTVDSSFYFAPLKCRCAVTAYPVIGPGFCAFTFRREDRQTDAAE